jgi:hypothetical protein
MIRSKATGKAAKQPARRTQPPKPKCIGFMPSGAPFPKQVHGCFAKAGFTSIRVGINRDWSLVTFWLKQGAHPSFRGRKQTHAALYRLLCAGGVNPKHKTLAVAVDGDSICGAFMPMQ